MKKLIAILIITTSLIASVFSFEFAVGGRGSFGGNIGNPELESKGLILGGGFYANLKLIGGFGLQAEVNLSSKTLTTGDNSITITPNYYKVIDVPIMAYYNYDVSDRLEVGGGAGINLSFYTDKNINRNSSTVNVGAAISGNIKYNVFQNIGLVLGFNGVFDFVPTNKTTNPNTGEITYTFGEGCSRNALFTTIGAEFKLGF